MTKGPIISVIVALLLVAVIYFAGNTKPPKPEPTTETGAMAGGGGQMQAAIPSLDVDSFIIAAKKGMSQHALSEMQAIDQKLHSVRDSAKLAPLFGQYAQTWKEHKQFPLAAYFYSLEAKLEKSEKKLTFAAQLFLDLARNEHEASVQNWEANGAIACYEQLLELNPSNDTARLSLAECYFGTGAAMKGVGLVKEITAKDPEHAGANLLLGQQGLISQQFEKAAQRFETVLKKDPKNVEAMLGLAEAFKGLGQKDKAKALLEECKNLIDNPNFVKDIDDYIKTF
ncbi:MAG: tetratricopeptide repeat protein [Chitinophagaceae bacterium]|nr:tetratricopeptide repeat protein [Chitinophagaceae bacterium]